MSLSPKFPWHSSIFLDNVPNLEALSKEMAASLILHSFMGQEGWSPPSVYYHLYSDTFVSSGTTCVLTDTTSSPCLDVLERPRPQSWQCCRIPPLALPTEAQTHEEGIWGPPEQPTNQARQHWMILLTPTRCTRSAKWAQHESCPMGLASIIMALPCSIGLCYHKR